MVQNTLSEHPFPRAASLNVGIVEHANSNSGRLLSTPNFNSELNITNVSL